ncbi:MAG: type 2 isopentenyl-diphosphate Delta-isomerase [Anaerolineales bacterium]|nr:MAG: type 2 isopentenyl-diphosphate Delta-isomerase [Anaerolineales bacterium]
MSRVTPTSKRKSEHIRVNLEQDVDSGLTSGLDRYRFQHEALPEIDLDDVQTETQLFGRRLSSPILISSMTGGTADAGRINATLAEAAQATNIAMGVGSQRAALEDPTLRGTFEIRKYAPDILLFANIGAIQLNYGYDADTCQHAVDMIQADALILHLNALQEALQTEGDTHFSGLLSKIEQVCAQLPVPVIAKEVGWGFSVDTARRLVDAGITAIDVAGAGGTSWSQVEMNRATSDTQAALAAEFVGWGIPTAEAIRRIHAALPELPIIASGGLRSGMDIAKCIALGAVLGGMAGPFLKSAVQSTEAVLDQIKLFQQTLRIAMFASGCTTLGNLPAVIQLIE